MNTKEIRDIAHHVLSRPRSKATVEGYRRLAACLAASGKDWHEYAVAHDHARSTAYRYRAATQFHVAEQLLDRLRNADSWERRGQDIKARELLSEAAKAATRLRDSMDYSRQHRHDPRGVPNVYRGPRKRREGGTRRALSRAPQDWRERVREHLDGVALIAYDIMAASGCRPAELPSVLLYAAGPDHFFVHITEGAKTGQGYGQPDRAIKLSGPLAERLRAHRQEYGDDLLSGETLFAGKSIESIQKAISRAADRAGCPSITAYSLRHAFSASLKAAGVPLEDIAVAMGHSVTQTQSGYGTASQARRAGEPQPEVVMVSGDREVTINHKGRQPDAAPEEEPIYILDSAR